MLTNINIRKGCRVFSHPFVGMMLIAAMVASLFRSSNAAASSPGKDIRQNTSAQASSIYLPVVIKMPYSPFNCEPPLNIGDPLFFSMQPNMVLINAPSAWQNCIVGSPNVVVAIVDSGVDLDHPDLKENLLAGIDYIDGDALPEDGNGHGTHVAGIIGASLNQIGVVGVSPRTYLLPVRVLDSDGMGSIHDVASGIHWAADHAQVINLSIGGISDTYILREAIFYAIQTRGRLVVAASGNCGDEDFMANGCDVIDQATYPAAYPFVFTVAAVDNQNTHASFSNSGSYVDISAPGVGVYSTFIDDDYEVETGTSMAAPHVAGLAALLWSQNTSLTSDQISAIIQNSALDLGGPGFDPAFGWGRIDVARALQADTGNISSADHKRQINLFSMPQDRRNAPIASGMVLARLQPGVKIQTILGKLDPDYEVKTVNHLSDLDVYVLKVTDHLEWEVIDALRALPEIHYAEPDYLISIRDFD